MASAAEVHKWLDASGITHYSDVPPTAAASPVTRIEIDTRGSVTGDSDYYSIANQWARMHRERIERERIKLERDRLKAASRPPQTEVVYREQPAAVTRYLSVYPVPRYRAPGHHRGRHKFRRHVYHGPRHRQVRQEQRTSLGFYRHVE